MNVRPGDFVKYRFESKKGIGERMWVKAISFDGTNIHGTLASEPVEMRMKFGQKVSIPIDKILDVTRKSVLGSFAKHLKRKRRRR